MRALTHSFTITESTSPIEILVGVRRTIPDKSDLDDDEELRFLEKRMRSVEMVRLEKTHEASWWNGKEEPGPSKLGHAFAADHLGFERFDGKPIKVIGWPALQTEAEELQWIESVLTAELV